jgi:hypothetical protein
VVAGKAYQPGERHHTHITQGMKDEREKKQGTRGREGRGGGGEKETGEREGDERKKVMCAGHSSSSAVTPACCSTALTCT